MMKSSKPLKALTILMTTAMATGPVYAHESIGPHGLIEALIPAGFLILAFVFMHRRLASRRSR